MGICDKFKKQEMDLNKYRSEKLEGKVNQKQVSGNKSIQFQADTIVYQQGIDEERARDIFLKMIPQALEEYTKEAYELANRRITRLETVAIPKIMQLENTISAFSDPAFQILLRKAQQTAAATEREDDYSLLSELLVSHIQKGEDRKKRMGITKAIEIVDDIDNDALCGLTVALAFSRYIPSKVGIREGLAVLDDLFSKVMYRELPIGNDWIDHLDILGAVRMTLHVKMKTIKEYYSQMVDGYVCVGIKKDSDGYKKAVDLLNGVGFEVECLIPNELIDGYVRLPVSSKEHFCEPDFYKPEIADKLNDKSVKNIFEEILGLYSNDITLLNKVKDEFLTLWDSFESLRKFRKWWEEIPCSFEMTMVGTALAYSNAKRCDPTLPDLM